MNHLISNPILNILLPMEYWNPLPYVKAPVVYPVPFEFDGNAEDFLEKQQNEYHNNNQNNGENDDVQNIYLKKKSGKSFGLEIVSIA